MKAMILAAGKGERMRPLTDQIPKPLLEVAGKPLIVWHLEKLAKAHFEEVIINHAYLGKMIEDYVGDGSRWSLKITYSREGSPLETAGGIKKALPLIGDQPFLVVNADIYTDFNYANIKNRNLNDFKGHLVMVKNPKEHPDGDFVLKNNQIELDGKEKLTFSGIAIYQPKIFEDINIESVAKLAPILK
ncbi:MAG: nucleotidyltransferase family protein, partial [Methylophilaceae bacterium]|nr:nucleotidyltransferase family protein [Methylophilaceae bacterium]